MDRMAPTFRKMEELGVFSDEEVRSIVKCTEDYEYILKRRELTLNEYYKYLEYEINLEKLLKIRLKRQLESSQNLKDGKAKARQDQLRSLESASIRHVCTIFDRAMRRFSTNMEIIQDYLNYLKDHKSYSILSEVFGKVLSLHPKTESFWLQAAVLELEKNNNVHAARILLQRSLRSNKSSQALWLKYFELECFNAAKLDERQMKIEIQKQKSQLQGKAGQSGSSVTNGAMYDEDQLTAAPFVVFRHAVMAIEDIAFAAQFYDIATEVSDTLASTIKDHIKQSFGTLVECWSYLGKGLTLYCPPLQDEGGDNDDEFIGNEDDVDEDGEGEDDEEDTDMKLEVEGKQNKTRSFRAITPSRCVTVATLKLNQWVLFIREAIECLEEFNTIKNFVTSSLRELLESVCESLRRTINVHYGGSKKESGKKRAKNTKWDVSSAVTQEQMLQFNTALQECLSVWSQYPRALMDHESSDESALPIIPVNELTPEAENVSIDMFLVHIEQLLATLTNSSSESDGKVQSTTSGKNRKSKTVDATKLTKAGILSLSVNTEHLDMHIKNLLRSLHEALNENQQSAVNFKKKRKLMREMNKHGEQGKGSISTNTSFSKELQQKFCEAIDKISVLLLRYQQRKGIFSSSGDKMKLQAVYEYAMQYSHLFTLTSYSFPTFLSFIRDWEILTGAKHNESMEMKKKGNRSQLGDEKTIRECVQGQAWIRMLACEECHPNIRGELTVFFMRWCLDTFSGSEETGNSVREESIRLVEILITVHTIVKKELLSKPVLLIKSNLQLYFKQMMDLLMDQVKSLKKGSHFKKTDGCIVILRKFCDDAIYYDDTCAEFWTIREEVEKMCGDFEALKSVQFRRGEKIMKK